MTHTAPEVTRLKPCPWCGGEARLEEEHRWSYVAYCYNAGCCDKGPRGNSAESAIDKWNTRTISEPDKWANQNPEAWEALRTGRAYVTEPVETAPQGTGGSGYITALRIHTKGAGGEGGNGISSASAATYPPQRGGADHGTNVTATGDGGGGHGEPFKHDKRNWE